MIVRRPQDPARFSGTVLVEWLNVTIGTDGDPSWGYTAEEIMREGHAWVGVSAQGAGVQAAAKADPARYGSLRHPGNPFSFDIFPHAARALTRHSGAAPLGELVPKHLIAFGQSQSAAFRVTAANTTQFTIQSRVLAISGLTNVGSEAQVVSGASGAGPTYTMTSGQADIYIGGHFDVLTTTPEGTYNGTLNVTVNFN